MLSQQRSGTEPTCPPVQAVAKLTSASTRGRRAPAAQTGAANALGNALKAGRQMRELSQLELSVEAGISQRHIGFIEVGRARPSRALLIRLLDHLEASPSLRNAALFHAGYPPEGLADSAAASALDEAMRQMVDAHFPFPAVVFDAHWHAIRVSAGAWWLGAQVMPAVWNPDIWPLDMIAAIASPDGFLSKAKDPKMLASALLAQIEAEAWATPSLRDRLALCAGTLEERYGPLPESAGDAPALTLAFDTDHGDLNFFSVQMVPGLPHNVSIDSVRVELSFPADARTREIMMREVAPVGRQILPIVELPA